MPDLHWNLFDSSASVPLEKNVLNNLEGVYSLSGAKNDFGDDAVLKCSYAAQSKDTTYYISIFCSEDATYFICQGKKLGNLILLNGYWRQLTKTKIGKARFIINQVNTDSSATKNIMIDGTYGEGNSDPGNKIQLKYSRPLYHKTPLEIVSHRGGGRDGDLLPYSENTVELIRMAAQLGATGVEIDVQLTKDGVPILYHDSRINDRLTQKAGVRGEIKEYTYQELVKEIELKNGEKIPTLKQALQTIVYETPLNFVWVDAKEQNSLEKIKALQDEFTQAAAGIGKKINIVIGIHDEDVFNKFLSLPGYKNIPSLCELEPEKAVAANAQIWAPLWTKGLQKDEVNYIHSQGKKAFVWTIDKAKHIKEFMNEGDYDGMVSNYACLAAYYYYTKQ